MKKKHLWNWELNLAAATMILLVLAAVADAQEGKGLGDSSPLRAEVIAEAIVDDPCPYIESLTLECDVDRHRLRATVNSELPGGVLARLIADDAFYRDARVTWHGQAVTTFWNPMPGLHEVCIEECDICGVVSCGCETDADCDDALYCNGEEMCDLVTGECLPGEPPCGGGQICDEDRDLCLVEKIIFSAQMEQGSQADIYCMNTDSTELINLTLDFDAECQSVAVSPDGRRIAFSTGAPQPGLWWMKADGTDRTHVRDGSIGQVRWFDNYTIFYKLSLSTNCPFPMEIRSIGVDGFNDTLVVANSDVGQNTTKGFDISPDRTMLVWDAQVGCSSPTYDIYRCDLEDTICTDLRPFYADEGDDQMDRLPLWSDDGQCVFWQHDAAPGVETPKAIVAKCLDSGLPVYEYDAVVRHSCLGESVSVCLKTFLDSAPAESVFLFYSQEARGLYVWESVQEVDSPLLSLYDSRYADWSYLVASP